jgi:tetratricopeptide (TPR) repeat protein
LDTKHRILLARPSRTAGILLAVAASFLGPVTAPVESRAGQILLSANHIKIEDRMVGANGEKIAEIEDAIRSYEAKEYDRCFAQLQAAAAKHPDLSPARILLATLHILNNHDRAGRAVLEKVAADEPNRPEVYLLFGELALVDGHATDALLQFQKAASLPAPPQWTEARRRRFTVQCQVGRASVAESRGDWNGVKLHLAACLEVNPGDGKLRQSLARARFELGEWNDVYPELQRAARDAPDLDPPAISMLWLYSAKGDRAKAAEWAEYARSQAPKDTKVCLGLAAWLLDQDRPAEARRHIETALGLDPDSRPLHFMLGVLARHLKDLVSAEREFQALYQQGPADSDTCDQLALTLAAEDDPSKWRRAAEIAESNRRLHPESAPAVATLGWVYFRLGRLAEAEQALQAAAASGGADSETAYHMARVFSARGKHDEAKRLLKIALDAPGRFIDRAEARKWLGELEAPRRKPDARKPAT